MKLDENVKFYVKKLYSNQLKQFSKYIKLSYKAFWSVDNLPSI